MLGPRHDRPHVSFHVVGIADFDLGSAGHEPVDELVVERVGQQQPDAGLAHLPRVQEAAEKGGVHRGGDVGVVEDDYRALSAQFEGDVLDRVRRQPHDRAPHRRRPGEGDLVDAGVAGEVGADLLAHAGDDVEDTRRQAARLGHLGEEEHRQRRLLVGLEDDGVPRRQSRPDLPERQGQRIVPWGDGGAHADRLPADVALSQRRVLRCRGGRFEPVGARQLGEVRPVHGCHTDVEAGRLAQGRPVGDHLELDELVGPLVEDLGDAQHEPGSVLRRYRRPHARFERRPGGRHRLVGVLDRASRRRRHQFFGGWTANLKNVGGVDVLAANAHRHVPDTGCLRHAWPPCAVSVG